MSEMERGSLSCTADRIAHIQKNANVAVKPPKRRGRPTTCNAARERSRVQTLRMAFLDLQKTLPAVPPDTKLSKLDVLVLATTYIAHLMAALDDTADDIQLLTSNGILHPVKKWPVRTRLYAGILNRTCSLRGDEIVTKKQKHNHASVINSRYNRF